MKIFVNITLLLILLVLLAAAVTLPRQWASQGHRTAAELPTFTLKEETDQGSPEPTQLEPDIKVERKSEPQPAPVTPNVILEIVSKLQRGESEEAALLVNEVLETLDDSDAIALQSIVTTETARADQLELMTNQLSESKKKLAEVEKSSREALDESLRTLAIATRRAEEATAESKERNREQEGTALNQADESAVLPPAPDPPKKAIELPANDLTDFAFGSTYLNDANKETLSKAIKILEERSELVVQLRGHTDTVGDPEYNAALANARCEMARDYLIEQGIENSRISIVSFGESQVFKEGVVAEKPRRVEILFRPGF